MAGEVPILPEPILVVGAYGYRNVGDEAILAGLVNRWHDRRITVASRRPAETAAMHGVRSIGLGRVPFELLRHRSVLIGGGGLFGTGMGRFGQLVAPFGLVAARLGRIVAVEAVGVDRTLSPRIVFWLRRLRASAAAFTVRDAASAAVLDGWGISSRIDDDLSAALPPGTADDARRLLSSAGIDPTRPVVGLCLTGLDRRLASALERAIPELVGSFPELQFCFIPMSQHPFRPEHDDLVFGRRLQRVAPRMAILTGVHHPGQVLAVFGALSAAVCMRFHSLLFSARAGIPIIAVPYAEKCESWLRANGVTATPPRGPDMASVLRVLMQRGLARIA